MEGTEEEGEWSREEQTPRSRCGGGLPDPTLRGRRSLSENKGWALGVDNAMHARESDRAS